ncbi:hypothetical protein [Halobaculum limi]|uniref:hypothetical protein n=1 Tax=Halobaculum limi TaxID=3031916 RepID=UPI002405E568|nr:hypothetical protein [Halobaculum sp. YSMS11]
MHTRRALLSGTAVATLACLAGCTGSFGSSTPDPLPDGGDGNGSQPSDREYPVDTTHQVAIASTDEAPSLPVSPRVSLADPYVTSGTTAVLRVDVDNTTDQPVVVGEYRDVVFQYATSGDGTYLLYPHSDRSVDGEPDRAPAGVERTGDDCWQLASYPVVTDEYGTVEIPANGTLTAYVGLYATPDADACTPTGSYRFEQPFTVFPSGIGGEDEERATWGFDLRIEKIAEAT